MALLLDEEATEAVTDTRTARISAAKTTCRRDRTSRILRFREDPAQPRPPQAHSQQPREGNQSENRRVRRECAVGRLGPLAPLRADVGRPAQGRGGSGEVALGER